MRLRITFSKTGSLRYTEQVGIGEGVAKEPLVCSPSGGQGCSNQAGEKFKAANAQIESLKGSVADLQKTLESSKGELTKKVA